MTYNVVLIIPGKCSSEIKASADDSDPIPRLSSCPSPGEPAFRQFDLGIHPAFHREIRPSGIKPSPSISTRRDASHGRETKQTITGEARGPLDAAKTTTSEKPAPAKQASKLDASMPPQPASGNQGIANKFGVIVSRARSSAEAGVARQITQRTLPRNP